MQKDKKRRAAVMAAVTAYIKSGEEAAAQMQAAAELPSERPAPPSFWGVSGRMDMMQYRNLMQLKSFHGIRR